MFQTPFPIPPFSCDKLPLLRRSESIELSWELPFVPFDASRTEPGKSVRLAYLLWAFLGLFGAHRLYLGFALSGAGMAAISLISVPLIWSGMGLLGFAATGTWMLADAVLIPGLAREANGN